MSQSWDAGLYQSQHAFVWKAGEDLVAMLDPKPGEWVLDLGCGTGQLTALIARSGARVVGADHSAAMLEKARANAPGVEFVEADAASFRFDQQFDAVFSNAVLHWVKDAEDAVCAIADALRPGGRFVAEFGGFGNTRRVLEAVERASARLGRTVESPWYYPTIGEYAAILERRGLEPELMMLFPRDSVLDDPEDGLRNWLRMFGARLMAGIPAEEIEEFLRLVEDDARPALRRDGRWFIDYRRLRLKARRLED
ncbi:MAG: class I SAM-dependent methyltransferase [Acidobacteria bacterium]|nr:class I SAM-dependent methyltransferase [Acidobacteriota bacterium]